MLRNKLLLAGVVAALAMLAGAQSSLPTIRWPLGKQLFSKPVQLPDALTLLVHMPNKSCQDLITLYDENRKPASAQGIALALIIDEKCEAAIHSIPVLLAPKDIGPNALGFLTENGILRRIARTDRVSQMLAGIASWQGGRQIYEAQCARCHGLDGTDTNYPSIKSLAGIGNRATESKIIEMTELTGAVDLHALSEKDRHALAAYVAGL